MVLGGKNNVSHFKMFLFLLNTVVAWNLQSGILDVLTL